MRSGDDEKFEYPDAAGYPDGGGTLDEGSGGAVGADGGASTGGAGTAVDYRAFSDAAGPSDDDNRVLVEEVTADALRQVDRPSADSEDEIEVHRLDERGVYAATLEGVELARVRFRVDDEGTVLVSTSVEPEFRGRGIATDLIADVLDDLRDRGDRLVVRCPVVSKFIEHNPEYAALVASS
ncbi:GNAT family N-acetyltransferase [Agromyces sp. GXQ0307]|uniref:GNAT family N-acetyltransferase n=1 Tax=Agromyces sp. GXQ0307 TaxID=3377835 RepID=UPI00383B42A4